MKKKFFLLLLVLFSHNQIKSSCCTCTDCSDDDYTSQSFMFTRPIAQAMVGKHFAWHNLIHDRHGNMLAALQFIALYQESMHHEKTAQYFLFGQKNCLKVAGDNAPDVSHIKNSDADLQAILRERAISKSRDIRAEWLGLPSDFSGGLTLDPKQQQAGIMFEYNQRLKKFFDFSFFD
ncbi:hypothetical protein KAH94_04090, partial [bacterium]|nr:hypothetical protein [bacterium]